MSEGRKPDRNNRNVGCELNLAGPLLDARLPAPNVRGVLADRQIRRQQLEKITDHVSSSWLSVSSIRCRIRHDEPCFFIHIEPFSRSAQQRHWSLAEWIESQFGTPGYCYFFLPSDPSRVSPGELLLFERGGRQTDAHSAHDGALT